MKRTRTALLLNAFVIPGLGQLYLGRKTAGIAIIMLVNLLLLFGLFVVLKGLSPVIAAQVVPGAISTADIQGALQGVAGLGKGLLAGFGLLWGYSIVDVLKHREDGTDTRENGQPTDPGGM
jgi:TM2 domain-containing membrane protein YozV